MEKHEEYIRERIEIRKGDDRRLGGVGAIQQVFGVKFGVSRRIFVIIVVVILVIVVVVLLMLFLAFQRCTGLNDTASGGVGPMLVS